MLKVIQNPSGLQSFKNGFANGWFKQRTYK